MTKIPMPSPNEKRRSIDFILQSVPQPKSFLETTGEMLRLLGWRGLFAGVGDAIFVALMSVLFVGAVLTGIAEINGPLTGRLYGAVFFFSPVAYMLLCALTAWKEHIAGVTELHNTCRFTLHHLTAVRMFCFGGAGTLVCGLTSWAVSARSGTEFMRLFGISLCALFLFASAFLFLISRCRGVTPQIVCIGVWCILGLGLCAGSNEYLNYALKSLPLIVFFIAAAVFLALYMAETRNYFMKKGESCYAVG